MTTCASGVIGRSRLRDWRILVVAGWLIALMAAFGLFVKYTSQTGADGSPPSYWPSQSELPNHPGDSLVLFAHPKCPCTRASLRELENVMAHAPQLRSVQVVFYQPRNAKEHWQDTDIIRQARNITGVQVAWDPDGVMADEFGVKTSGHVLLYDAADHLRFSGGITGLRSHEGWNRGSAALLALQRGKATSFTESPIYGCPIFSPSPACLDEEREMQP